MSLFSQFKTNEDLERAGVLLEYGMTTPVFKDGKEVTPAKPITIRIARAGGSNRAYEKMIEAEIKPYRRLIQNETIEATVVHRILRRVYAKTIVLGWENVQDENGNDIVFSSETCEKLFEDLPDLFLDIQNASQKAAIFRADIREIDGKN